MRTVLTLTTSPQRMQYLPLILDALFNQITLPDAVYLNLPERYRNRDDYIIPGWLNDASRVTLLHCGDDLGPVMKIMPVLEVETDLDTLLITVDDDVRYPSDTISTLQTAAQAHPESAFGSRGFNFTNIGQHLEPVRGNHISCHVLQGYGACAYRRWHFDIERLRISLASQPNAFRFSDDIILSNHIAARGVARFTIELSSRLEHMPWGDEDSQSLKFVGGGTHRRYEAMRRWLLKKGEWFAQDRRASK
ncbi:MAG: hypothetical protein VYB35_04055 [Verrucomicrobiota bacterium]|nr:hypothetical protein [Verrucomicrobiota bacterium]|tara:strand:+ start:609 stop:1355 length:747 start_codon:yes stop_codon:yes gene_type:complete